MAAGSRITGGLMQPRHARAVPPGRARGRGARGGDLRFTDDGDRIRWVRGGWIAGAMDRWEGEGPPNSGRRLPGAQSRGGATGDGGGREGCASRRATSPAGSSAPTWRPERLSPRGPGDRVTWERQTRIVQEVRGDGYVDATREGSQLADAAPATELRAALAARPSVSLQPVWPPAAPSQLVATTKRTRKPTAAEVDPEKDKLLVNAFADAIKQAAASVRGA